jgi:hypothetical protein
MPYIYEARYIRYMEIGEIKQQMRKDLAENKLNPLQKSLFEPRPPEFLFDIENDLWETRNLASLSGFRGKNYSKQQAGLLSHPDKIVRYWAIAGLRSQNPGDLAPHAGKIIAAMNDPYPPVAVTASTIVV